MRAPGAVALGTGLLPVAANQNSSTIALYSVDASTGALTIVRMQEVCATPFFVWLVAP